MGAPRFRPGRKREKREWTNEELDELLDRVEAVEGFCAEVNDYLHDEGDEGHDRLRDFFLKKFAKDPEMVDLVAAATEKD